MVEEFAGGSIRAQVFGAGETVWVLHSLLADAGSCLPFAQALAPRRRVVVPDLPGFGGSAAGGDIRDVAARVGAAMAEDGPAVLVGNGYGSFVALLIALARPEVVRGLVLAGTGAAFDDKGRAAFRGMAAGAAAKGLEGIVDVAMRRLFSPSFQAANPGLMAERRAAFLRTDPAVFGRACGDLAALDLSAEVGALRMPVLALAGDGDEATPAWMAEALAGMVPGGRFTLLPGLAHVPQLQDVTRFVAAVEGVV